MVNRIETNSGSLRSRLSQSTAPISSSQPKAPENKAVGDPPPRIVNLADYPSLAPLFSENGFLQQVRKKLFKLSQKNGRLVLAQNTIAAADSQGLVYIGADFLLEFGHSKDLIAGVLAHEWGHIVSGLNRRKGYKKLSWEELWKMRREEEGFADGFCGHTLPLLGYSVDPLIAFLMRGKDKLGSHKYYSPEIRAEILRQASLATQKSQHFAKNLFEDSTYTNPWKSKLIAD